MQKVASNHDNNEATKNDCANSAFRVKVSIRFIIIGMLSCLLLAFAVGRTARNILIVGPQQRVLELQATLEMEYHRYQQEREHESRDVMQLPNPVLKNKPIPKTIYTSMNFDTARSSSVNSRWVVIDDQDDDDMCESTLSQKECQVKSDEQQLVQNNSNDDANIPGSGNEDDEFFLPMGQHLLMDIRNVQSSFLASEERLAKAMLNVVGDCGLTLLSYHCHGLTPSGVSCVGVLLESHVSFHTWPSEGVITLDLFTCGSQSLLPIVESVERLFGMAATSDGPETVWAYKVRGFGDETNEELADLFTFPIGTMTEYKKELVSIEKTSENNQRIDVYDVLRPVYQNYAQYKRSLVDDDSYESRYKDIFQPDRILFVNGILQSRRSAEIPYHEALVHPAMFAHELPSRVLLLNCGGGAALREVLKHKSVTKVIMVEEEKEVVRISQEFFPEYHDCSNILGGSRYCLDDPKVELIYSDIYDWADAQYEQETEPGFDVIILDEIYYIDDPIEEEEDLEFFLFSLLSPGGVLTEQVGDSLPVNNVHSLRENGFQRVVNYEEGHLGFSYPWQFVMAFKNNELRIAWDYAASSWHDGHIGRRLLPTLAGDSSLFYFDGEVMQGYSYPSKRADIMR